MARRPIHQIMNDGTARIPLGRGGWDINYGEMAITRQIADAAAIEANTAFFQSRKALEQVTEKGRKTAGYVQSIEGKVAQSIRNMTDRIRALEQARSAE